LLPDISNPPLVLDPEVAEPNLELNIHPLTSIPFLSTAGGVRAQYLVKTSFLCAKIGSLIISNTGYSKKYKKNPGISTFLFIMKKLK
jgi:hypothetical protein